MSCCSGLVVLPGLGRVFSKKQHIIRTEHDTCQQELHNHQNNGLYGLTLETMTPVVL